MGAMGKKRERGQAALESAIALPMLIALIILLVQASWMVYCAGSVTPALTHAQYSISAQDLADGKDANELIRERMIEASPVLASGELTVSGASIGVTTDTYRTIELPDEDFDKYLVATKNELTQRARITAHVEYRPVSIFAAFGNVVVVRDIDASKIVDERFELG